MESSFGEMTIESKALEVLRRYPIRRAALFGSAAAGHMNHSSDVDILVEFEPDTPGLSFFGLKLDLEEALDRSVDLLTWRSLAKARPGFRASVERGARVIYEQ